MFTEGQMGREVECATLLLAQDLCLVLTGVVTGMAEAGEEELLLDALSICAGPFAILATALSPEVLAALCLSSADVMLAVPDPPFRAQLRLTQVRSAQRQVTSQSLWTLCIWMDMLALPSHVMTK